MQFIKPSNNKWVHPAPASRSLSALSSLKDKSESYTVRSSQGKPSRSRTVLTWGPAMTLPSRAVETGDSQAMEVKGLKGFAFLLCFPSIDHTDKMHLKTTRALPLDIFVGSVSPFCCGWWAQLFCWLLGNPGKISSCLAPPLLLPSLAALIVFVSSSVVQAVKKLGELTAFCENAPVQQPPPD